MSPQAPPTPGEADPHRAGVLVLGYGSDLRGDDALGRLVAEEASGWEGVRALSVHQLTPELALELETCAAVVFADAVERSGPATLERLEPAAFRPEGHQATPAGLLDLGRTLHGHVPEAWMLALPGQDFSLRETLSPGGERSLRQGLELLAALLGRANPLEKRPSVSEIDARLIEVPHQDLSPEALQGVLEEYCTRGGYDSETPLASRVAEIRRRLADGRARLVFDPEEGMVNVAERKG